MKIAKQRETIVKLDAGGHDISEALGKSANFERACAEYRQLPAGQRKRTTRTDSLLAKEA
jgi:hypothetical protein